MGHGKYIDSGVEGQSPIERIVCYRIVIHTFLLCKIDSRPQSTHAGTALVRYQ